MQKLSKAIARLFLRAFFKPFHGPPFPLGFQRRWSALIAKTGAGPSDVHEEELWSGELRILRFRATADPAPADDRDAILFAHGGGFVVSSAASYANFAGWIATTTGADVYVPDYRLAPEHPSPAPTDDLFAAYRTVLGRGHVPERTAILGDSAGGALAVSTALALREMDVPAPAALVLLSPWLDLTLSAPSITANARRDPMLRRSWLEQSGRAHAGTLRRADPRVSPLFAELRSLPPTLIQVGSDEILLDDSVRFADRAWGAGVEVEIQRFEGWWHDFQSAAATLRGAREALDDVAAFLARRFHR